jgi:hypothetical protein
LGVALQVEAFCLVACPENSVFDTRDYHAPIVTPFELEVALGQSASTTYGLHRNRCSLYWTPSLCEILMGSPFRER